MVMKSTIYLNNQWYTIPQEDGMIPGTTLYASWQRSESDGFKFAKIAKRLYIKQQHTD